jgi:exosortase
MNALIQQGILNGSPGARRPAAHPEAQPAAVAAGPALAPPRPRWIGRPVPLALVALIAGCAVLAWPTMLHVARESWSTEQGGHGPIVLMTGLWLLSRIWPAARPLFRRPPLLSVALLVAPLAALLLFARIVQVVEIEGFLMYGLLLAALYSVIGARAVRRLWFPLIYLAFMFPLPDTVVAFVTLPLKTMLSQAAIAFLAMLGYPIGGAGVMIMIGPYELLVAAACSGLNSIISLSVIGLFYLYVRHEGNWRTAWPAAVMIVPIAILANFVRILLLILLTYHAGDAAAQGYLHDFAGLSMFAVALGLFAVVDEAISRGRAKLAGRAPGDHARA